jgi:hypothetical protein
VGLNTLKSLNLTNGYPNNKNNNNKNNNNKVKSKPLELVVVVVAMRPAGTLYFRVIIILAQFYTFPNTNNSLRASLAGKKLFLKV